VTRGHPARASPSAFARNGCGANSRSADTQGIFFDPVHSRESPATVALFQIGYLERPDGGKNSLPNTDLAMYSTFYASVLATRLRENPKSEEEPN